MRAETLATRRGYRWVIFAVISAQYIFVYFHRVCPAVVAPDLVKTFDLSGAALGVLSSGYFYAYAVMQIPVGMLIDVWGARKTVFAFNLLAGLAALLFGFSPSFLVATIARVLVGLGVSATFVSAMTLYASWFKPTEFARISGAFAAIGGLGWLSAATPLAVLSAHIEWRGSFIVVGIITLLLAFAGWFLIADRPDTEGISTPSKPGATKGDTRSLGKGLARVLSEKYFWPLAIWAFLMGSTLFAFFGLWAGPYLIDAYKLTPAAAGNVLSMIAIALIVGGPVVGFLSDQVMHSRKRVLVAASIVHVACWYTMAQFHGSLPEVLLYTIFFCMGISTGAAGILAVTTAKELFPPEITGAALGTINLFPFVGGMLFQPVIGMILDTMGKTAGGYPAAAYGRVCWLYVGVSLAGLIAVSLVRETYGRHR